MEGEEERVTWGRLVFVVTWGGSAEGDEMGRPDQRQNRSALCTDRRVKLSRGR